MIDAGPDVQGQDDYQRAPFTVASDNEDARLQKEYRVLFDRLQGSITLLSAKIIFRDFPIYSLVFFHAESEKTIEISGVKEIIDEANTLFRNGLYFFHFQPSIISIRILKYPK